MNRHFEIYQFDTNDVGEPELFFTTEGGKGLICEIRKPKGEDYRGTEYRAKDKYGSWSIYENELNIEGIESRVDDIYDCVFSSGYFSSDYIEKMGGNDAIYRILEDESDSYRNTLVQRLEER